MQGGINPDPLVEHETLAVVVIAADELKVFEDAAVELVDLFEALLLHERTSLFATDAAGAKHDHRLVFELGGQPFHGGGEIAEVVDAGRHGALERAELYTQAGADVLFVEAPQTRDQMDRIIARFAGRIPLLANMVEGGKTPLLSAAELERIGYSLVIFPGGLVRAQTRATQDYFATLLRDGTTAGMLERMADFDTLNKVIGTPELLALGKTYDEGNI